MNLPGSSRERDQRYMRLAIESAGNNPRCPFGAVLVDAVSDQVVARGYNRGQENPTWHGEIDAINCLARGRSDRDWQRLHLYTTAEPCCMCQAAILWAGISRVVYGTSIARLEQLGWNQIAIRADEVIRRTPFRTCQLLGGVLEAECDRLFVDALSHER